jgi:hypothetical protein
MGDRLIWTAFFLSKRDETKKGGDEGMRERRGECKARRKVERRRGVEEREKRRVYV